MSVWNSIFHNVFGVGHIRMPLMLAIPIGLKLAIDNGVDAKFMQWNAGATQKDIWDRLEKKVADAKLEEEADAE